MKLHITLLLIRAHGANRRHREGIGEPSRNRKLGLSPFCAPENHQAALRERLRQNLLADRPDGPFTPKVKAWAVSGIVP
jgi:hypothetical protein